MCTQRKNPWTTHCFLLRTTLSAATVFQIKSFMEMSWEVDESWEQEGGGFCDGGGGWEYDRGIRITKVLAFAKKWTQIENSVLLQKAQTQIYEHPPADFWRRGAVWRAVWKWSIWWLLRRRWRSPWRGRRKRRKRRPRRRRPGCCERSRQSPCSYKKKRTKCHIIRSLPRKKHLAFLSILTTCPFLGTVSLIRCSFPFVFIPEEKELFCPFSLRSGRRRKLEGESEVSPSSSHFRDLFFVSRARARMPRETKSFPYFKRFLKPVFFKGKPQLSSATVDWSPMYYEKVRERKSFLLTLLLGMHKRWIVRTTRLWPKTGGGGYSLQLLFT